MRDGLVHGGEALPRGRHDQFRLGRARFRQGAPGAGGDGRDRPAALRPWRGRRTPRSTSSTARRCSSTACCDPIREATPGLRVVMEHITTRRGRRLRPLGRRRTSAPRSPRITWSSTATTSSSAASGRITTACRSPSARNTGWRLRAAATSGDARFFLGTDSAPHVDPLKEQACGCAGCFTATNTLSFLAEVFEQEGALDRLEAFASLNGPAFYGLPPNEARITLDEGRPGAPIPRRSRPATAPSPSSIPASRCTGGSEAWAHLPRSFRRRSQRRSIRKPESPP